MDASRPAFAPYAFEGAALVGRDMIGLVALDLVLGIVFRRAMPMALVVEIPGVDGDDGPGHPASLGVPAHMIPDLERPCHHAALPNGCRRSGARNMTETSLTGTSFRHRVCGTPISRDLVRISAADPSQLM